MRLFVGIEFPEKIVDELLNVQNRNSFCGQKRAIRIKNKLYICGCSSMVER